MKKIFVGNLPWKTTTEDLVSQLSDLGIPFRSVKVIQDDDRHQSKGYGFVEVAEDDFDSVVEALNGYVYEGRKLNASLAKPRKGREEYDLQSEFFPK